MTKQFHPLSVRLRVDFGPDSSIGPGKIALLEHIDSSGSLSQAARELGMSYRRAWLLLADLNQTFTEPVATASAGGTGGGGALLTPFGKKLVFAYRDTERETGETARKQLSWLQASHAPSRTASAASRRPINQPVAKPPARAGKRARATKRS
jgi:molybdate transport system regulatory protein